MTERRGVAEGGSGLVMESISFTSQALLIYQSPVSRKYEIVFHLLPPRRYGQRLKNGSGSKIKKKKVENRFVQIWKGNFKSLSFY